VSANFHKFWLKFTAIIVGSFGPIFVLGTMRATTEAARLTLDLLSWPVDGGMGRDDLRPLGVGVCEGARAGAPIRMGGSCCMVLPGQRRLDRVRKGLKRRRQCTGARRSRRSVVVAGKGAVTNIGDLLRAPGDWRGVGASLTRSCRMLMRVSRP
jgi:hypothetical protein